MPETGRYAGRVAVVTGARRGLGRIFAEHLLDEGAVVMGMARGDDATIDCSGYEHIAVDVGDEPAVRHAFHEVGRRHGRLDLLINCAAVLTSQYALLMPGSAADAMVRTNFLGTLFASREAAKLMAKGRHGRIVNISSMAVVLEPPGDSVYAATKAACSTLAGVLAKELGPSGITVNTLGVSAYATDMLAQLPPDKVEAVLADLPVPRAATREELLHVLDFFLADAAAGITAQTVYLGGVH